MGGSVLVPVHSTQPVAVRPQCCEPLVKVGVLVLLRQKARPLVVSWCMSPLPLGSANSHVSGSPIVSPRRVLSSAKPRTKRGDTPGAQRVLLGFETAIGGAARS